MNPKDLEEREIRLIGELNQEHMRVLELVEENLAGQTFSPQTDASYARKLQLNLREGLEHARYRIRKLTEELVDVRTHLWRLRYRGKRTWGGLVGNWIADHDVADAGTLFCRIPA